MKSGLVEDTHDTVCAISSRLERIEEASMTLLELVRKYVTTGTPSVAGVPKLLTTVEAGRVLRLEPKTVAAMCARKELDAKISGRQWLIPLESVLSYEKKRPAKKKLEDNPDFELWADELLRQQSER